MRTFNSALDSSKRFNVVSIVRSRSLIAVNSILMALDVPDEFVTCCSEAMPLELPLVLNLCSGNKASELPGSDETSEANALRGGDELQNPMNCRAMYVRKKPLNFCVCFFQAHEVMRSFSG